MSKVKKAKHTLMWVMDDPTGRVDKTMDEMLITKRCYQHYRPQSCPHFTHNHFSLIRITINGTILNKTSY